MALEILHRDDLPLGGFAGLKEHRLVVDPRVFGPGANGGSWPGLGSFIYLADARFMPRGETMMHEHRGIDVISVVVEGRIAHAGSLGHGEDLTALAVQVQRSGDQGFAHNEINPDDSWNRMIQIWAVPEPESPRGVAPKGRPAEYKVYRPETGTATRVYGGPTDQAETFAGGTLIDVARLDASGSYSATGPFIAYLTKGRGTVAEQPVADGDLIRGHGLRFDALSKTELIVVHTLSPRPA